MADEPGATPEGAGPPVGPGGQPGPRPPARRPDAGRRGRSTLEWLGVVVLAVVVTLLVRSYVVEAYYIPSGSMEPTLHVGDRVLVNKLSYDLHSVHIGDIVVFSRPPTEQDAAIKDLIKRVVGLPGETIQSGPAGQVIIDGHAIAQPWLTPQDRAFPGPNIPKQTLGPDEYYVLGDNRGNSADSRYIGPISGSLIVGKAELRVWPLTRLHLF